MSGLQIVLSSYVMAVGVPQIFLASGGTGPYTFKAAFGTVDGVNSIYTAPAVLGPDTLTVVDSVGAQESVQILICDPIQLFCDILQVGMGLAPGRVYLWDQKIFQPEDDGLFIPIEMLSARAFSNSKKFDPNTNLSVQSVNTRAILSVDLKSRSTEALFRKEEMLMALNSDYSLSQQALNSFRIFPLAQNFLNLSEQDGSAIPYRFNISVAIQYMVVKSSVVPYYDTYSAPGVFTNP